MNRIFKKGQIFTIPNLLSLFRLLLIPVIICLYCVAQKHVLAVCIIVLSGITDIVDGFIARKFNMITDLGKILDPVADKLTQATVIICLITKYKNMLFLIATFAISEISKVLLGFLSLKKKDSVNSARWFGKANTVVLYVGMALLILFPKFPANWANVLIFTMCVVNLACLVLYIRFYRNVLSSGEELQDS